MKPLPRRETAAAAPSNKVVLTLSRELLVVIAVAAVLALIGAFVWGHSLGSSSPARVAASSNAAADEAKTPLLNMAAQSAQAPSAPSAASPYYTLRLKMTGIDRRNAGRIAADLCAMGYDAFALQLSASSWSVNIGRFASADEAEAFKKRVSPVTYKNQRFLCSRERVSN